MYSGGMDSNARFALLAGLVIWSTACSSSSSTPSTPDASEDATASDGGQTPPDDAASGAVDASQVGDAGAVVDAGADADTSSPAVDASAACMSYCTCMATNCPDKVFGSGCLYECATQTTWDLPCRANMCSLVQAQPNNDHCTHAFGVNECLDE